MNILLITGSEGGIGCALRSRLARPGRTLRLLDLVAPEPGDGVEVFTGSITDPELMASACAGVAAVVHLAGISGEAPWTEILHHNVHGAQVMLDAAQRAGVGRVVLASSNHVTGMATVPDDPTLSDDTAVRPDTFYGVSKTAVEALGALYADRHHIDVSSLRIGTCTARPGTVRHLSTWLSFDDCARLIEACLATPGPPAHRILWGMSANTRGFTSPDAGAAIGYHPRDDAENFAAEVVGEPEPLIGGTFTRLPLGG